MQTTREECYRRAQDFKALGQQEQDPERRAELLETADEYLELIKLLQDA